jgi:hypothetical protein
VQVSLLLERELQLAPVLQQLQALRSLELQ